MPAEYIEGYWDEGDGKYPKPVKHKHKWKGQDSFIKKLKIVQGHAEQRHYKGFSYCRLCKKDRNGTADYRLGDWVWPEGFIHYLEKHNVRPSLAFQAFIEYKYAKFKRLKQKTENSDDDNKSKSKAKK